MQLNASIHMIDINEVGKKGIKSLLVLVSHFFF